MSLEATEATGADEVTPNREQEPALHTHSSSLGDMTMLELTRPAEQQAAIVQSHQPTEEGEKLPKGTLLIVTETANLQGDESSPSLLTSLVDLDFELIGKLKVSEWKGNKFYSDYIAEGLKFKGAENPNVVMLFESPSSSTDQSTFHNKRAFRFHDWPPPKSTYSKSMLGPCRYASMNGTSYPVFLRDEVPPGLLEHWAAAIPDFQVPRFVRTIHVDTDTVYAYLPVEQIPKHVNDPHKHYHLAGKDAIHLMTQKTTRLLTDTSSRPCVVKTTHSMGSKGVFIIEDDEDDQKLEQFLKESGNPTFVITDFVDIARNVACHFYMHPDGKSIVWFGSNENRRGPDGKFTSDSYLIMADQKELKEQQLPFVEEVVQYCHGLGFFGFCGIDVLFDSKGRGYLVDINPRVTGSSPALMTLRQLKAKYNFTVGLFRRSGDISFYGTSAELLDKVTKYNTDNEGTSRIVIHAMYQPEGRDYTQMNIGVYGTDLEHCETILKEYALPRPQE